MVGFTAKINDAVAGSIVGRRFRLQGSGHAKAREGSRFLTEIRAGLATFFAMAYIISVSRVNPGTPSSHVSRADRKTPLR
jgi:AGZA family xanthine/uracil permease-like MFS transporter